MENKPSKEMLVYACGYCGKVYRDKKQADMCHSDRTCDDCGVVIGKASYSTICDSCMVIRKNKKIQDLYNKATKMSYDEYMKLHPEYPVVHNDEFYFDDLDYLLEKCEDEDDSIPNWVWGAELQIKTLDPYRIIEQFEEDCELEDYSMDSDAQKEIIEFCKQWNEKHSQKVYYEDNKVVVLLPEVN